MKKKKLTLEKITIANLGQDEMNALRGGFDLEDYATSVSCDCKPPANDSSDGC